MADVNIQARILANLASSQSATASPPSRFARADSRTFASPPTSTEEPKPSPVGPVLEESPPPETPDQPVTRGRGRGNGRKGKGRGRGHGKGGVVKGKMMTREDKTPETTEKKTPQKKPGAMTPTNTSPHKDPRVSF